MPLRDHFRPVSRHSSWEGFHSFWPAAIVTELFDKLPPGYVAEPRVHLGAFFEVDVCTFEEMPEPRPMESADHEAKGGVATATWSPPAPSFAVDAEIPEPNEYEVLIYDVDREDILSPPSKS
jgi:hypothetical protein